MAAVWDMDLPRDQKLVLLAYADHADDSGGSIYPAVAMIARKTGYSERSIQGITKELAGAGVLVLEGTGPKGTRRWRMDLSLAGANLAPRTPVRREAHPSSPGGDKTAPGGDRAESPKPSIEPPQPSEEPSMRPTNGRPRDSLFDAIVETCQVDPATAGASVGKVRAALLKATPPYTAAEVNLFRQWWWSGGYRKRPPRVWDLQEQIGVVRTETPRPEPKGFAAVRAANADLESKQ